MCTCSELFGPRETFWNRCSDDNIIILFLLFSFYLPHSSFFPFGDSIIGFHLSLALYYSLLLCFTHFKRLSPLIAPLGSVKGKKHEAEFIGHMVLVPHLSLGMLLWSFSWGAYVFTERLKRRWWLPRWSPRELPRELPRCYGASSRPRSIQLRFSRTRGNRKFY